MPSSFEVGTKLASCTKTIASCVLEQAPPEYAALNRALAGRRIVLVDTPGCDTDEPGDDKKILKRITQWLADS